MSGEAFMASPFAQAHRGVSYVGLVSDFCCPGDPVGSL